MPGQSHQRRIGCQKGVLFATAGTRPAWTVAHCAAVLAVSTTCRGIELKHLRWGDVDLFERESWQQQSEFRSAQKEG